MTHLLCVFVTGIIDGWREPDELTSGLTFPDMETNEAYDRGVNVGQAAGTLARSVRNLGKQPDPFRSAERQTDCPSCKKPFGWNTEDGLEGQLCGCGHTFGK